MASLLTSIAGFRSLLVLAISLGVLSAQAGAGTLAVFTDTATSASNTFTTGSVDLQLNNPSNASTDCTTGGGGFGNSLASALFNQSSLTTAGAVFTQSVCVKNNGSLPLQWGLATSALTDTGASGTTLLADTTRIRIYKIATTSACSAGLDSAGAGVTVAGATDLLPSGGTNDAGSAKRINGTADNTAVTVGNSNVAITAGAATALAASGGADTQKLCVSVVLPNSFATDDFSTANSIQGQTVTGSFTFTGTAT